MTSITGLYRNNLRRVSEVSTTELPAVLSPANARMGTAELYVQAGEEYQALTIPGDVIITKIYALVSGAMLGTADVNLTNSAAALFSSLDITGGPLSVSTAVDIYTDTPEGISIILDTTQDATVSTGSIKIMVEYISLDTNNGIYGG